MNFQKFFSCLILASANVFQGHGFDVNEILTLAKLPRDDERCEQLHSHIYLLFSPPALENAWEQRHENWPAFYHAAIGLLATILMNWSDVADLLRGNPITLAQSIATAHRSRTKYQAMHEKYKAELATQRESVERELAELNDAQLNVKSEFFEPNPVETRADIRNQYQREFEEFEREISEERLRAIANYGD